MLAMSALYPTGGATTRSGSTPILAPFLETRTTLMVTWLAWNGEPAAEHLHGNERRGGRRYIPYLPVLRVVVETLDLIPGLCMGSRRLDGCVPPLTPPATFARPPNLLPVPSRTEPPIWCRRRFEHHPFAPVSGRGAGAWRGNLSDSEVVLPLRQHVHLITPDQTYPPRGSAHNAQLRSEEQEALSKVRRLVTKRSQQSDLGSCLTRICFRTGFPTFLPAIPT